MCDVRRLVPATWPGGGGETAASPISATQPPATSFDATEPEPASDHSRVESNAASSSAVMYLRGRARESGARDASDSLTVCPAGRCAMRRVGAGRLGAGRQHACEPLRARLGPHDFSHDATQPAGRPPKGERRRAPHQLGREPRAQVAGLRRGAEHADRAAGPVVRDHVRRDGADAEAAARDAAGDARRKVGERRVQEAGAQPLVARAGRRQQVKVVPVRGEAQTHLRFFLHRCSPWMLS